MSVRRYLNVVMANHRRGIYSLRRFNSDHFFYLTKEAAKARDLPRLRKVPDSAFGMKLKNKQVALSDQPECIRPPPPIFSVQPSRCPVTFNDKPLLNCFPLSASKIFFTDSAARNSFYDTEARCLITAPCLHEPKYSPIALAVPSHQPEGEQDGSDPSLYIMDMLVDPRRPTPFEALIRRKSPDDHFRAQKTWHCDTLPVPPFFHHSVDDSTPIFSYAVVGDVICVSAIGFGTYCFDTVGRTWSLAGDWQMPFSGKAEYVPELKLWFGLCADNPQLPCAADLSPVLGGHEPKRRYVWGDPYLPEDWLPSLYDSPSIVSLGSGRFCITNFFEDMKGCASIDERSDLFGQSIAVLTGLEVLAGNGNGNVFDSGKESGSESSGSDSSNGKGKGKGNGLHMIKHKSRFCRMLDTQSVKSVF